MATLQTTLNFLVTQGVEDGTVASLLFDVRPDTTAPPHLLFLVTQVAGAFEQLQPSGAVTQQVRPEITYSIRGVDEVLHPSDLANQEMTLELLPDGVSWKWSFLDQDRGSTRAVWVPPVIDWPVNYGTVAPGKSPVAVDIIYRTADLETMRYQVMAEGITKSNSSDLAQLECQGVGAEGRWDSALVSVFLPPAHGLTGGAIARLFLEDAHDPDGNKVIDPAAILFGDEIGVPLNNPVDKSCVNAWGEASKLLDELGFQLVPGVAGDLSATVVALPKADVDSASKFTLTEGDFLTADFEIDAINSDHETCVIVESKAVDTTNPDGSITTKVVVLVFDFFSVEGAFFGQSNDTLDPIIPFPGPLDARQQLKSRTTTATTFRDGCPERVEVTKEAYFNPIAARYSYVSGVPTPDLNVEHVSGVFIKNPEADDFDNSTAYLFRYDQWTITSYTVTHLAGTLPRWIQEVVFPFGLPPPEPPILPLRDSQVGRQLIELTYEGGWLNPQRAVKGRIFERDPWEEENYFTGLFDAKLNGVVQLHEFFYADIPFSASFGGNTSDHPVFNGTHGLVVGGLGQGTFDHDRWLKVSLLVREALLEGVAPPEIEGGLLKRKYQPDRRWGRLDGSTLLYGDGTESQDLEDTRFWRPIAKETNYTTEGPLGPHSETETEFEVGGGISPDFPKVRKGLPGTLPAMPVCFEKLRDDLVPLRVIVCLNPSEDVFVGREATVTVEWIETEEGLEVFGIRLLRELTALGVSGTIPVDARLRPWLPGTFDFPRRGYNSRRCWVDRSSFKVLQAARGKIASTMAIVLKVPTI